MKPMKHFFTLIEILTVAAIIAILAGISVGVIGLISNKNAEARTQATIKALELALGQYKSDNGNIYMPKGASYLHKPILITVTAGIPDNLNGTLLKYMDQKLLNSATKVSGDDRYFIDGWGRPLIYRMPGKFNKTGFDLGSAGPDGKVGDSGIAVEDLNTAANYAKFGKEDDITNFTRGDTDPGTTNDPSFSKIL
ncbi:MAG: type II secretion system protein GspG [Lentisphaeria bacterium]|nr:type II secretion system protein GspG [Lentisphaeria bacterium]